MMFAQELEHRGSRRQGERAANDQGGLG